MTNYTDLEKTVYNALIDLNADDYSSDLNDLSQETGLEINTIKGVLGSLTKKGMIDTRERDNEIRGGKRFLDVWPLVNGDALSFGGDHYEPEELESFKI